jgi:hypothetical protein
LRSGKNEEIKYACQRIEYRVEIIGKKKAAKPTAMKNPHLYNKRQGVAIFETV